MQHTPKSAARQSRRLNRRKPKSACVPLEGGLLPPNVKITSVLRRIILPPQLYYVKVPGLEGHVCAFQLAKTSSTIFLEAASGRVQTLIAGDIFLGTPGHRESNIVLVAGIPNGGLIPGKPYSVISDSGVVGQLTTQTRLATRFVGEVKYLGAVTGRDGGTLSLRRFAVSVVDEAKDQEAKLCLIVGTGPEVGKTTAGIGVLRAFLASGCTTVTVLKATGTSSFAEIANYLDHGAARAFDCVDFGMPTTYPSNRKGMERIFDRALDACFSLPADALVIECGGDMLAANIPTFLRRLKRRRTSAKVVLAAADPLGAWGGTQVLRKFGLPVTLIAGPCTDTPASQRRTQSLCKVPSLNMLRGELVMDNLTADGI